MKIILALFGAMLLCHVVCQAGSLPREPEKDNGEYMLDLLTNTYSRVWREIWDAGDNRFRLRLGSNNTGQWFLEEEFKFSADLLSRLRFRYHHSRLLRNSSEQRTADTFEFEGNFYGNNYVSVFATPTFLKAESSIGIMLQNRRAVNRFSIVFVEFPQFMRNFAEHRRNGPDSLLSVLTDDPVRFGLDIREPLGPNAWLRLAGEYIPSFELADEVEATGLTIPKEQVEAAGLSGWVEYGWNTESALRQQTAVGLEAGYRKEESRRMLSTSAASSGIVGRPPATSPPPPAPRLLEMEFDGDLFDRGRDDSVKFWEERRVRFEPYARVVLSPRYTLRARVRLEERTIEWQSARGHSIETEYVVSLIGVRMNLGSRRQSIIEAGIASEFRKRSEEIDNSSVRTDHLDDHRIYISYEHVFGDAKIVRITEAIELDGEDVGEFRIHDHGFVQMIFGF